MSNSAAAAHPWPRRGAEKCRKASSFRYCAIRDTAPAKSRAVLSSVKKKFNVTAVLDRWYGPDRAYYKITADDGNTYIIAYDEKNDEWELEFFQKR